MATWAKYGLASPGWFQSRVEEAAYARLPRAARFRLALENESGLFPTFARFLVGRVDLLPSTYLDELRKIQPSSRPPFHRKLEIDLADQISGLEGIQADAGREVFGGVYQQRPILLEVYSRSSRTGGNSWTEFRDVIRRLKDGPEAALARPAVLEEFATWVDLQSDIERKRGVLANLQTTPSGCLSRFPRLIPELQSATCLVYERMQGASLGEQKAEVAAGRSLPIFVEAVVEQALLLSVIDSDISLDNYLLLPDGTIGVRVLPAWVCVPAEWHYELLQYVVCSTTSDASRALQMLCRMCSNGDLHGSEQLLRSRLSSLNPELKVDVLTPESVIALENYWRALADTPLRAPLFLQLWHRNVTVLGQHNASVAPSTDLLAEALWPVLGRVMRFHLLDILSTDKAREWIVGSGLFFMAAMRQVSLSLERFRETGNGAAVLDLKESESRDARQNRRTAALIRAAIALVAFLSLVQLAFSMEQGLAAFGVKVAAIIAGAVLVIFVSRVQ